jgi:hypothetical protein
VERNENVLGKKGLTLVPALLLFELRAIADNTTVRFEITEVPMSMLTADGTS